MVKQTNKHCQGTLEQGTKPTHAHTGPCDELATHPGVDLPSPRDPEKDKVEQEMRDETDKISTHTCT